MNIRKMELDVKKKDYIAVIETVDLRHQTEDGKWEEIS